MSDSYVCIYARELKDRDVEVVKGKDRLRKGELQ